MHLDKVLMESLESSYTWLLSVLQKFSTGKGGGYDCNPVEPLPKDFECSICLKALREPNLTSCCGQHFCESCIQRVLRRKKPCPLCGKAVFKVMLDKKTQRKVLEVKVQCGEREKGCDWVGELAGLEAHSGSCEYKDVKCTNGCGLYVTRKQLNDHLTSHCSKRIVTCKWCSHEDTQEKIEVHVENDCEEVPTSCPNSCQDEEGSAFPRKSLKRHLSVCGEQEVDCEFSHVGCSTKVKRKCLQEHLEGGIKNHLSLLSSFTVSELQKKESKLLEKDNQLKSIERKLQKKEKQLNELKEELGDIRANQKGRKHSKYYY